MLNRLFGLMLIIRGLSPLLVVGVIAITGALMVNDVQSALREPVAAIRTELDQVSATVGTIRGQVDVASQRITAVTNQVTTFVGSVGNNINSIVTQFRNLLTPINDAIAGVRSALNIIKSGLDGFINAANSIVQILNVGCPTLRPCIQLPTIPTLQLPNLLPDIEPLAAAVRSAFAPLQQIFIDFQPAVDSIRQLSVALQSVPAAFARIGQYGQQLVSGVESAVADWGTILIIVVVILLVLTLNYFAVPLVDNVTRGWRLLRGLPA
jgi:hypothetical protein